MNSSLNSKITSLRRSFLQKQVSLRSITSVTSVTPVLLFVFTGFVALSMGYWLGNHFSYAYSFDSYLTIDGAVQPSVGEPLTKTVEEETSAFEIYKEPLYTPPTRLILPFGKEINVNPVGVNSFGQLEVPQNPDEGGWYLKSAKVGEKGNVLINAHYDDSYGRPAAFYNLKSIKVNDTVILVDSYDRKFSYRVTEVYYLSIYDENRIEKLLESQGHSLTLVTCGGFWVSGVGYNQRLIVKAQLAE
ncbi:MAG TPA: class F sortase [bacterium]|nr:class F sortase [bacterium]